MKIGIFGDSYADNNWPDIKYHDSWIDLISRDFDVESFGQQASSLYYGKALFDQHHDRFDRNIFLVTHPGRYTLDCLSVTDAKLIQFSGLDKLHRDLKDSNLTLVDKARLRLLKYYVQHVRNWQVEEYFHQMMLNDIVRLRPDTVIIPCFINSVADCQRSLKCISDSEIDPLAPMEIDLRPCHLSSDNNRRLYLGVVDAIQNNSVTVDLNF